MHKKNTISNLSALCCPLSALSPLPSALRPSLSALRPPLFALRPSLFALRSPPSALRPPLFALRSSLFALPLKIPFPLLLLHTSILVEINNAGGTFAFGGGHHLLNDFLDGVGLRFNCTG